MRIRSFIIEKAAQAAGVRRPFVFFLITVFAALALWLLVAAYYEREATNDITRDLVTINTYKTAQIADWVGRHQREAARLSRHPFMGEIITEEVTRPGSRRAQLKAWLNDHASQKRYVAMAFLTTKGVVITATQGYVPETGSYFSALFARSLRTGAPLLTDLYPGASGRPRMAMLSPITAGGKGGRPLCMLVIKIDPEMEFYPLVKASPLLFAKAETLLVRKEGDSVLFLNDLDQKKDAALKFKLPLSTPGLPAAAALNGKSGYFSGTDYSGARVFSALDRIEGTGWAVVTKVNQATILAPVRTKEALAFIIILMSAGLMYGFLRIIVRAREKAGREALEKTETSLRVSEQIFREFMEHSPIYVFFKDENIRALHLSRNFEEMIGRPLGQLLGKSMNELFPSELAEKMVADDKRILREGKKIVTEEELNGRTYSTIKFPIKIEGKPTYLAGYTIDITEQKQAEAKINSLNERFSLAASAGHLGIWDWDIPNNILAWDDRMFELYGIRKEDFSGTYDTWLKAIHPDDRARCDEAIRQALAGAKDYEIEFRTLCPDGTVRHMKANGDVFLDAAGKPLRMVGVNLDITARKLAYTALSESEQRYRLLLNSLPETSVLLFDRDHRFLIAGGTEIAKSGFDKKLIEGRKLSEAYPPEVVELFEPLYDKALKGEASKFEHWYGTAYYFQQILPVLDSEGAVSAGMVVSTNLTARKAAEKALQENERALREAQEMAHLGYWNWDIGTGAVIWSEEVYRIFRLDPEKFKPRIDSIMALSPWPEENARDKELIRRAMETHEKGTYTQRFLRPDKSTGYYLSTFQGKYDGQGRLVSIVGTILDITDRRLAELALEKLNRDLSEKTQEMESFLYITTHDLRSPLVNIQGFSQNLEHYIREIDKAISTVVMPPDTEKAVKKLIGGQIPGALKFVLESSRNMDALITALLKVSRIGRVEMKPVKVDMNALLGQILVSLHYQLEVSGGKISCGELPPCRADAGAVSQLFTNLLDNAIKYRDPGRLLKVTVTGEVKDGMAVYAVADSGSGIPENDLGRIWDIFYRPGSAPGKKGEGIGLPMVKRITEKNGGRIMAESKPGEGSVFHVSLPMADDK